MVTRPLADDAFAASRVFNCQRLPGASPNQLDSCWFWTVSKGGVRNPGFGVLFVAVPAAPKAEVGGAVSAPPQGECKPAAVLA
jgi:hypothetical protein